ncbi:hypothetical protein RB601_005883 [Gaeumannomyces tritici]
MSDPTKGLKTLFQTERLVFRRVEGDEDRDFIHNYLHSDPVNNVFSGPGLLRPSSVQDADEMAGMLKTVILGVMICLPPAAEAEDGAANGAKQTAARHLRPEKLTTIGYLWIMDGDGMPRQGDGEIASGGNFAGSADLGISIAEAHQGKGYGAEAINWAVDWAFRYARLHRIGLNAVEFNERACALYRRLGFKDEGRLRELQYHDRRWWDVICFSMLEHEWEELRGWKKA